MDKFTKNHLADLDAIKEASYERKYRDQDNKELDNLMNGLKNNANSNDSNSDSGYTPDPNENFSDYYSTLDNE